MAENNSINISMSFRKIRPSLTLLLIGVLAIFLRLYSLNKLMVFTPDEEYILYITQSLIKHFHIIWIGVSALGFDFYMGPGLNYFLVPFIWLTKGDPVIWGVLTSSFGTLSCFLIYYLGKILFNKKTGIIAVLIWASSALLVFYDQQPYPTGVPLLSLSMLLSIYLTKYSKKWWIAFSFLYGIVFHIHLSLFLVIFVAIYWALSHRQTWNSKTLLLSIVTFLLVISPLIGFDYFHKFSNITAPLRVVQEIGKSKNKFNLANRINSLAKAGSRIFYLDLGKSNVDEILYPCNSIAGNNATFGKGAIILLLVVLLFSYFKDKSSWKNEGRRLLLIYSLPFLVPFIFLSSIGSVEYYLLGFFPVLVIIIAYGIVLLPNLFKYAAYALLLVFCIYNVTVVLSSSGDYGLQTKKQMISDVMNVIKDSSFELKETGGPCQGTAGWGYLFSVYGQSPNKNTADKQFSWLVTINNELYVKYLVVINESRITSAFENYKYKLTEGGFTAYIFEN